MARKKLEHHERDKVRRPCIAHMRKMQSYNQLKRFQFVYWTCPLDMGRLQPHIAMKNKLDGYTAGNFDMTIIAANGDIVKVWLIEFKYETNSYTEEQKIIAIAAEKTLVQTLQIKSIDQFEKFISENL